MPLISRERTAVTTVVRDPFFCTCSRRPAAPYHPRYCIHTYVFEGRVCSITSAGFVKYAVTTNVYPVPISPMP